MRAKTLQELANYLGAHLQGDPLCSIIRIAPIEKAKEGDISFVTHKKYRKYLSTTAASAVIISPEEASECKINALISDNPRLSLVKVAELFIKEEVLLPGIHPSAILGTECVIAKSAYIGPNVVIGNNVIIAEHVCIHAGSIIGNDCRIGEGSILKAKVVLYDNVTLKKRCLIHSGAVIGADGFGFANHNGHWVKMPHLAGVLIGDEVEIGANTTIDRGVLEETTLEDGVIIDNLVQIGHNVKIGKRTAIAACVAIAGSTHIGKNCLIGGGARIGGHIEIVSGVHLTATSAVNTSIMKPGIYSSGFPAKPNTQWRRNVARFQYLDDMAKRIRALENALNKES
jgi:UDP-3-O-[3-hydroxymyristoyl] glucosamine N-acyltransferase